MKHHQRIRKLGRVRKQRTALLRSLARELILRGKIKTTQAKAKELRPFVEKIITKGKTDSIASRRHVAAVFGNQKKVVQKLFKEIAPQYKERNGGYTRITKLGVRKSDAAAEAQIEFVE